MTIMQVSHTTPQALTLPAFCSATPSIPSSQSLQQAAASLLLRPTNRASMAARCPYFAADETTRVIRPGESPAAALRRILATPGAHQAPCCFDALGARLVERAGFPIGFMGGACAPLPRIPRAGPSRAGLAACLAARSRLFLCDVLMLVFVEPGFTSFV